MSGLQSSQGFLEAGCSDFKLSYEALDQRTRKQLVSSRAWEEVSVDGLWSSLLALGLPRSTRDPSLSPAHPRAGYLSAPRCSELERAYIVFNLTPESGGLLFFCR